MTPYLSKVVRIVRKNRRIGVRRSSHFDARNVPLALEPFNDDQVAWRELTKQLVESRSALRRFTEQCPARAGRYQYLLCAGVAIAKRVLAGPVHIEPVMRILQRRHRQPIRAKNRNQFFDQRRLTAVRVANESNRFHSQFNRHAAQ